jgi:hypothetical protein
MRLTLEIHRVRASPVRPSPERAFRARPMDKREQHQQDEGASNLPRINSDPREQQRQDHRQITHGDNHQQHHRANGNARLPLASSASFGKNGAPAAQPSSSTPEPQRVRRARAPSPGRARQGASRRNWPAARA